MTSLTVNGHQVTVSDEFLKLPPEQQQATVDEIAKSLPAPQSGEPGLAGSIDAFGRGAANMAGMGYMDEIGAALDYAGSHVVPWRDPKTYDQALQDVRGSDAAVAAEHPAANIAGAGAGLVGGGMGVARGMERLGVGFGTNLAANAPLTARAMAAAKDAGILGAISGFGQGQDGIANRLESGAVGGLIGSALGPALTYAGAGIGNIVNAVKNYGAARTAGAAANISPEAVPVLNNLIQADDALGAGGASRIAAAGNEGMLADAGPNMVQVLDTAIQKGGPANTQASQRVQDRFTRSAGDFTGALDTTLGVPSGKYVVPPASKAAIREAYPKAYAQPIDYSDPLGQEIEQIVKNQVPQDAISAANKLMKLNGDPPSAQIHANEVIDPITGAKTYELTPLPDVRQLDYITRGLNQVAQEEAGKGQLGGQTAIGRAYGNLSGEIRDRLRTLVPEYGNALDLAGTEIGHVNADKLGNQILSQSMTRGDVADSLKGLGASEKEVAARATRQWLDDKMANVQAAFSDPNMDAREAAAGLKALSTRAAREKMELVIGKDRADAFFEKFDQIMSSFQLRAALAQNSKTFPRQAMDELVTSITEPNVLQNAAVGATSPIKSLQSIAKAVTGQSPAHIAENKQEVFRSIADLLTRPAAQAQRDFGAFTAYGNQLNANQLAAQRLAAALRQNQSGAYLLGGNPTSIGKR